MLTVAGARDGAELSDELLLVREVHGEFIKRRVVLEEQLISVIDARVTCVLEDDRVFHLERVPPEIVFSLKKMNGENIGDDRERLVDILVSVPEAINSIAKYLKRIIINSVDSDTGIYSALVEFGDGAITIKRKMVPSHAIFLARLTNRPIYIKRELVDQQEAMYSLVGRNSEVDSASDDDESLDEE